MDFVVLQVVWLSSIESIALDVLSTQPAALKLSASRPRGILYGSRMSIAARLRACITRVTIGPHQDGEEARE